MALYASHLHVQSSERVACIGMVEAGYVFPVRAVVAALAIFGELAFVEIFMARQAGA